VARPYLAVTDSHLLPTPDASLWQPTSDEMFARPVEGDLSDAGRLFLTHLPVIETVISSVCRHHHLPAAEGEEFASFVKLALLERDAEVLRQRTSAGSTVAFLRVVISRLLYDFRCKLWGRWRPSATAKRHGPVAILLERLVVRDGLTFDEAVETAQTNNGVQETHQELWDLYLTLGPPKTKCRSVPEAAAHEIPSRDPTPEAVLTLRERDAAKSRLLAALQGVRATLTSEEQLLLKMRVDDRLPVSRIAAVLDLNQKRLYARLDRLYDRIREKLNAEGFSSEDVDECFQ